MRTICAALLPVIVCGAAFAFDIPMGPELEISSLDNQQLHPRVAYNSIEDEFLVVWHNQWPGNRDIYAQRLDDEGNPLSWFAVSVGSHDRITPDVAYDPVHNRYLVVWLEDFWGDGSDWDVWGRFVDWDGPDPSWAEFAIDVEDDNQSDPQVVFGRASEEFLAVWTSVGPGAVDHVEGRRMTSATPQAPGVGQLLDIAGDTHPRRHPDVAYNLARNEYLVVYDIDNGGATGFDIFASRLRGDGVVLGGEIQVSTIWTDLAEEHDPVVVASSELDQYFVVWLLTGGNTNIDGVPIGGDGSPAWVTFALAIHSDAKGAPAISCQENGSRWDMAWHRAHDPVLDSVEGAMIIQGPTTWDWHWSEFTAVDTGGAAETTHPAMASGRTTTLVVWEHGRSGTTFQDLHGRILWPPILVDGFDGGTTDAWSAAAGTPVP